MPKFNFSLRSGGLLLASMVVGLIFLGSAVQADDTTFKLPTSSSGGDPSGCCRHERGRVDDNLESVLTSPEAAGFMTVDVNTPGGCSTHSSAYTFYGGFGFAVPAGAAISGLEVLLDDAYVTHAREPLSLAFWRVELSWDNGATWSTAKDTGNLPEWSRFSSTSVDYTLGTTTDDWGHTWAAGQLSDASFQLRLQGCTEGPLVSDTSTGVDTFLDSVSVKVTYSLDQTSPVIVPNVQCDVPGNNDWCKGTITVDWTVTDSESVISSSTGCTQSVISTDTPTLGTVLTCEATSAGGTDSETVTVYRDGTAPGITIAIPPNNTSYVLNQTVVADYGCTDVTSGILTCAGPVSDDSSIATSVAGSFSFKVDAEDIAGNTATATNNYSVSYAICPLYDQLKAHKVGSTVPVKLQLCDASGVNVSNDGIVVQAVSLTKVDGSATGVVDDAGASNSPDANFRYSSDLEGYIFNLSTKTPALGNTSPLTVGTWKLCFKVDTAASETYCVTFDVK